MAISESILGLKVIFTGKDDMSAVVSKVNKTVKVLQSEFARAMTTMQVFSGVASGMAVAGQGMLNFLKTGTESFREFEAQVLFTTKVVSDNSQIYGKLSEDILQLSGSVPIATQELARLSTVTAQMGFRGKEIGDVMKVTSRTMLATGIETEKIALLFGGLRNAFGKKGPEAIKKFDKNLDRLASTLVHVGNATAGNAKQVAEASLRFAGVASQFGFAAEEIFAFSSSIIDLQFKPARAGSAMAKLLAEMQTNAEEFARVAKLDITEFKMAIEAAANGTEKASNVVLVWLKAMQTAGIPTVQLGQKVGDLVKGHQVLRNIVLSLIQNVDSLNQRSKDAAKAFEENKALTTALTIQMQSLDSQLTILDNKWLQLKITLAATLKPILMPMIKALQSMLDLLNSMSPEAKRMTSIFMAFLGVILIILSKLFLLAIAFNSLGIAIALMKSAFINLIAFVKIFMGVAGIWLAGVLALVAAVVWLAAKWEDVVAGFNSFGGASGLLMIKEALSDIATEFGGLITGIVNSIREAFGLAALESVNLRMIVGKIFGAIAFIAGVILKIVAALVNIALVPMVEGFVHLIMDAFRIVGAIVNLFRGLALIFSGDIVGGMNALFKAIVQLGKVLVLVLVTPVRVFFELIRGALRIVLRAVSWFGKLLGFNMEMIDSIDDALSNKTLNAGSIFERDNAITTGSLESRPTTIKPDRGGAFMDVTAFASGGLVDKPTLGLVGEAGPELITPVGSGGNANDNLLGAVNQMSQMLSSMVEEIRDQNENGEVNIPINININGKNVSKSASVALSDLRKGGSVPFNFYGVG